MFNKKKTKKIILILKKKGYYQFRYEEESKQFGKFIIKNEGLDYTIDPLFNVTHLVLWMENEPTNQLKLQHWQWDWQNFTDFDWPFRLLLRYIFLIIVLIISFCCFFLKKNIMF